MDPVWKRPAFLAAAIIFATTLARLWFVASHQLDLVQDEAQYWDWSRILQLSYYSKGPLVAYIISLGTWLFGDTELGVRFGAVAGSCLMQIVLYLGVARLFQQPKLGVWCLVVINTTLFFLANSVLMTTDNPLALFWLCSAFCMYWAAFGKRQFLALCLLALCLALGLMAKYLMLAFGLTALFFVWGLHRNQMLPKGLILKLGIATLLGLALGALPILLWNLDNDFVSFRHVASLAGVAETNGKPLIRLDTLPEFLGSQIGLSTPWWFLLLMIEGWRSGMNGFFPTRARVLYQDKEEERPDPRVDALLSAGFWPVFLFFLVWSLHTKIYPNWPGVCYLTGVVLGARIAMRIMARLRDPEARAKWQPKALAVCLALGGVLFLGLHLQNWLPVPADYNPMHRLKGWRHLGEQVQEFKETAFEDADRVFFFSDEYDITAALAFYIPERPRTFCAFVDRRMSQYDLWPGPEENVGWDAIYVRKRFKPMSEFLRAMFESVEDVEFQSFHWGEPARKFTVSLCRNFQGPWPSADNLHY
ncbi:MAG: phospholipid carrier-dependent glycosyltransferase [Desulfovibrio sp.]|nr:MAG: phospholipid carrier-dependent glycosyltransferase [Desulfovibrio sp.]